MGARLRWSSVRVFWLPKAGNSLAEYEDAFWPREEQFFDSIPMRLAVADGATETSFSGLWARLLVTAYGRGRLTGENLPAELHRLRRAWRRCVGQKPLPWYAEEKLRWGAFSSLLGLTVLPPELPGAQAGRWRSMAVGDSCVVQARGDEMVCSLPFTRSDEFNSRPILVSSLDSDDATEVAANSASGSWQAGDIFYLMTDALAGWCLRGVESGEDVFARLNSIETQVQFEILVTDLRSTSDIEGLPVLKNDDVTLVQCTISSDSTTA